MTEPWRCFIAAPIDEGLRASLEAARASWLNRSDLQELRWTDPAGWHVTLAFLGDVDRPHVPVIVERVASVAQGPRPILLPTNGLGAFPNASEARVAWYGIGDPLGQLAQIVGDLAVALELGTEHGFRPHLTLARVRRKVVDLRDWILEAGPTAPSGMLSVHTLHLMRSHRGRGSPAYETLAELPLPGLPR